jgi:hypothetical protein
MLASGNYIYAENANQKKVFYFPVTQQMDATALQEGTSLEELKKFDPGRI